MTCEVVFVPDRKLALQLMTFGDKAIEDEEQHLAALRMVLGVFFAKHFDPEDGVYVPDDHPKLDKLMKICTSMPLIERGFTTVRRYSQDYLAMYSYINYTRVTSEWAQTVCKGSSCQITARLVLAQGDMSNVVESHTVIVYF